MTGSGGPGGGAESYRWTFGGAVFDEGRWELALDGQPVVLERKPLEVLQYLLRHAGEAVTKEELLSSVWAGRVVVEAVLTNAVGKLRRALGGDTGAMVVTLPTVGYRLDGQVNWAVSAHVPPGSRLAEGDAVPRRGNWVLAEALARGGDGEVWLARHAKTGDARVFKFSLAGERLGGLKREVTVGRLLDQALGERRGFVKLIDWDFEQAPYFIEFEYGGSALDRWQDADGNGIAALPLETRLALFCEAADAVASAHEVGVLHKDIKPANLLVEGDADALVLRVADFGSSGVFEPGLLEGLGITRLGLTQTREGSSAEGTHLYIAPELVAGQAPSVRSDIYSLGVTLYQLVVGNLNRPLAPGWRDDVEDALLREDIADAASGDPLRRPGSVRELIERLRRLPERREQRRLEAAVRARVEDGERRLARLRAQRPWMVVAMVLLVAGVAVSVTYARRAHEAGLVAQAETDRATASLQAQTALNRFLSDDVIGAASLDRNAGKQPTVLEALDTAESGIARRFADDPGSAGTMRLALAHAYNSLAMVDKADVQFRAAVPLLEQAFGPFDERSFEALLGEAHTLIDLGGFDDAARVIDLAGRRIEEVQEPSVRTLYRYGHARAVLYEKQGNHRRAGEEYSKLIELASEHPVLGREIELKSKAELGTALLATGEPEQAVRHLEEALDGLGVLHGPLNLKTIQARQNLVQALMQVDRMADAREQIDLLEQTFGQIFEPGHPQLANINIFRAISLVAEERYDEAQEQYGRAYSVFAEAIGPGSPYAIHALQYRCEVLRWAGRSSESAEILADRLQDAERVFGDPSPALADYATILSFALLDMGAVEQARRKLRFLHLDSGLIADDVNQQRIPYIQLLEGRFAEAGGNFDEALEKYQGALDAFPTGSDYWREVSRRIAALAQAGA